MTNNLRRGVDVSKRICSIEDCENLHYGRGYCSKHYQRWSNWGDPLGSAAPKPQRRCSEDGCELPHFGRGMCRLHHSKARREQQGENPGRVCNVDDCVRVHAARGMCATHYRQWKQENTPCAVVECLRNSARQGYCRGHWDRWKKFGDPLAGPPIKTRAPNGAPRPVRTSGGYVLVWAPSDPNAQSNGYALEHKVVMAAEIGRPLFAGENVHHINGVKDDNRPENLELWVTMQPSGQRPADLVKHAREILQRYGHLVSGSQEVAR